MLSNAQRAQFFRLAKSAYSQVSPGVPFEQWRAKVMESEGLPLSTKQMDVTWDFERAMFRLAVLAEDYSAADYYSTSAKRRLEWILGGLARDIEFLKGRSGGVYIEAVIDHAHLDTSNLSPDQTRRTVALVDSVVRKAARQSGVELSELPTAGRPWCIRGRKAAKFAAFIGGAE